MKRHDLAVKLCIAIALVGISFSCSKPTIIEPPPRKDIAPCPQGYVKASAPPPQWIVDKDVYPQKEEDYIYFNAKSEFIKTDQLARDEAVANLYVNALVSVFGWTVEHSKRAFERSTQKSSEYYNPSLNRFKKINFHSTPGGQKICFESEIETYVNRCFCSEKGESLYECWVLAGISKDMINRLKDPEKWVDKHKDEIKSKVSENTDKELPELLKRSQQKVFGLYPQPEMKPEFREIIMKALYDFFKQNGTMDKKFEQFFQNRHNIRLKWGNNRLIEIRSKEKPDTWLIVSCTEDLKKIIFSIVFKNKRGHVVTLQNFEIPVTGLEDVCECYRKPEDMVREIYSSSTLPRYRITIRSNHPELIEVAPRKTWYNNGEKVVITAKETDSVKFTRWLVGKRQYKENPLVWTVKGNVEIHALFESCGLRVVSNYPHLVKITPERYKCGDRVRLYANDEGKLAFKCWIRENEEPINNRTLNLTIESDMVVRAIFEEVFRIEKAGANQSYLKLPGNKRLELVRIPAGEFIIGDAGPDDDPGGSDNARPQKTVRLSEYWIGKYEVTIGQYNVYLESQRRNLITTRLPNLPITNISWDDANEFCMWLSEQTGRDFSLPTEAQWEKAARGTDGRLYPWGNDAPGSNNRKANINYGEPGNVFSARPVENYPLDSSPFAVRQMAGNVSEWCKDFYKKNFYIDLNYQDPEGTEYGNTRSVRGGNFSDYVGSRCSYRYSKPPGSTSNNTGFRVVLTR